MVILDGIRVVGPILAASQTKQGKKQGRRRRPRPEIAGKVKACTYRCLPRRDITARPRPTAKCPRTRVLAAGPAGNT